MTARADNSALHRKLVADTREQYGREPDLRIFLNSKGRWDRGEFKSTPGLGKGSSDLICLLTTDFYGKLPVKVGVLLAGEAKTGTGRLSPEQDMFLSNVLARGGYGFVFHTPEEFGAHLERARRGVWIAWP